MNYAAHATSSQNQIRRTTFTPPQPTAHAACCGLFLLRRAYITLSTSPAIPDICHRPPQERRGVFKVALAIPMISQVRFLRYFFPALLISSYHFDRDVFVNEPNFNSANVQLPVFV